MCGKPKPITFEVNSNGCHICTSHCLDKNGYPKISRDNKTTHMSRYLWTYEYGAIPEKMFVLHTCDTPQCINIKHFFLGTNTDNMADMVKKNRCKSPMGEHHKNSKLTTEIVKQIFFETGLNTEIAIKFNISKTNVGLIKRRMAWKHITSTL